jgi:hypothetical protein
MNHRQNAGITQKHFADAARGRIAVTGGEHIVVEQSAGFGQPCGKLTHRGIERMGDVEIPALLAHCLKRLNDIVDVKYGHSQCSPSPC